MAVAGRAQLVARREADSTTSRFGLARRFCDGRFRVRLVVADGSLGTDPVAGLCAWMAKPRTTAVRHTTVLASDGISRLARAAVCRVTPRLHPSGSVIRDSKPL